MPNINIRLAERKDTKGILAIYAPYIENSAFSFETTVPTEDAFWQRIQKTLTTSPWLVCTIDDKVVGYAYAGAHRYRAAYQWNQESSVYVHPGFWRRNIAKILYITLIELLKIQGYTNLLAGIVLPNPPSIAFHQSLGFQLIGTYHKVGYKFGQYHDTQWWELFIGDGNSPRQILPMKELIAHEEWQSILKNGTRMLK